MRNIIFEFEQAHAIKLGLKIDELLLLSYFYNFFQDGRAKWLVRDGERYFLIRYSKIHSDLPILGGEKTMRRAVAELERKNVLKRFVKGNRDLYLWVHWKRLFGQEETAENIGADPPPQNSPPIFNIDGQNGERNGFEADNLDQPPAQKRAAIDSYLYKLKIITNIRAREVDRDLLFREVKKQLEISCSRILLDTFFIGVKITETSDSFVEFGFATEMSQGIFKKETQLLKLETATIAAVKAFAGTA